MVRFEYCHVYIVAVEEYGKDPVPEIVGYDDHYPTENIEQELSELGADGWELVNMTAHWKWTFGTISNTHEYQGATEYGPMPRSSEYEVEVPYSIPAFIAGWYCTFKRELQDSEE